MDYKEEVAYTWTYIYYQCIRQVQAVFLFRDLVYTVRTYPLYVSNLN